MNNQYTLELLQQEWIDFLKQRGHQVEIVEGVDGVVVSQSKKENHFRWILFISKGLIRRLQPDEQKKLAIEIQRAKANGQKPYVVVYFSFPESKLIVKPATRALETGRIGSTRGGFAWLA